MKAFTVFMFLPASVAADGVLSYEKTSFACVFSWHFNGSLLHELWV